MVNKVALRISSSPIRELSQKLPEFFSSPMFRFLIKNRYKKIIFLKLRTKFGKDYRNLLKILQNAGLISVSRRKIVISAENKEKLVFDILLLLQCLKKVDIVLSGLSKDEIHICIGNLIKKGRISCSHFGFMPRRKEIGQLLGMQIEDKYKREALKRRREIQSKIALIRIGIRYWNYFNSDLIHEARHEYKTLRSRGVEFPSLVIHEVTRHFHWKKNYLEEKKCLEETLRLWHKERGYENLEGVPFNNLSGEDRRWVCNVMRDLALLNEKIKDFEQQIKVSRSPKEGVVTGSSPLAARSASPLAQSSVISHQSPVKMRSYSSLLVLRASSSPFICPHRLAIHNHKIIEGFNRLPLNVKKAVDIGTGRGLFLKNYRLRFPDEAIIGLEISLENIHSNLSVLEKREIVICDILYSGIIQSSVDKAYINMPDSNERAQLPGILTGVWRILKPNGLVYITTERQHPSAPHIKKWQQTIMRILKTKGFVLELKNKPLEEVDPRYPKSEYIELYTRLKIRVELFVAHKQTAQFNGVANAALYSANSSSPMRHDFANREWRQLSLEFRTKQEINEINNKIKSLADEGTI
ncbi:MAG: hypothetical protein FJ241_13585, partial [Nitrospira sp.]|nr:hypothetical protein [Nitrospira sp.]